MLTQQMPDDMLWQCLYEAEQRKHDSTLPIDVRVRSAQTYGLCLIEAHNRGYSYTSLRSKAEHIANEQD